MSCHKRRLLNPQKYLANSSAGGFSISLKFVMPAGIRGPQFGNHSARAHLPVAFLYATNNSKGSLLEKLIAAKLAKFHAFCDTQKFITVVTTASKFRVLWNM